MPRRQNDQGATAAEYAMLAALIAGVAAGAIALLGQGTVDLFKTLSWP